MSRPAAPLQCFLRTAVHEAARSCCMMLPVTRGAATAQINPITVLGLTETSAVPPGGWLLQTAAGSVSRVQDCAEVLQLWCFSQPAARVVFLCNEGIASRTLNGFNAQCL
jgi:hypothetical protein